jgi:hypothetical protein
MSETENPKEFRTTPEEARANRRQVWLILVIMLASSCVGVVVLTLILWFLFKKVIPPGLL